MGPRVVKSACAVAACASVLLGSSIQAQEETYCTSIKPTQLDDKSGRLALEFRINYDIGDSKFVMYSHEPLGVFGFVMNRAQADTLIGIIEKYEQEFGWGEALLWKEKLPAETTFWKSGDIWSFGPGIEIAVSFVSDTEQAPPLMFEFPKVVSDTDSSVTHKGETLYFDRENALELRRVLLQRNVEKFIAETKTRRDNEKGREGKP